MAHKFISARCVARDLSTIAPHSLERTCLRQTAAQRGDSKKSQTVPFNAFIIVIIIITIITIITYLNSFYSTKQLGKFLRVSAKGF